MATAASAFGKKFFHSPGRVLLFSILVMIGIGTLLLALPWAHKGECSLLDLFFTATSATCVTGLLTIPLDSFTPFGHYIILILIQIGGLGLITLTVFLMSLFVDLGLGTQFMAGEVLELTSWKKSRHIMSFIILFTVAIELLGALGIFMTLPSDGISIQHRLFLSIFHAISAFCSAGFVLFHNGIMFFKNNPAFLLITTFLMLVGELGFVTWYEIKECGTAWWHKKKNYHFSLHSKIVFSTTFILITVTIAMLWFLEHRHSFSHTSPITAFINIVFDAVSYRSTGFTTLNIATVHLATFFLIMIISFIGASPGSTGSGIKTTTFVIFMAAVRAVLSGRNFIEIKGRRIVQEQVFKAMAILALSLSWIAATTFILLITEEGWRFVDIIFESFSAFTNLGLSTGITPYLSNTGKIILSLSMLVGRIGSVTALLALRRRKEITEYHYPEERIMLG
ncbi:MAG: potassium transporter TrkG [Candidatus Babeliaceae bacterium]